MTALEPIELAAPILSAPLPADIEPRPTSNEELGVTLNLPFGSYDGELLNPAEIDIPNLLQRIDIMLRTDGHFRALARLLSLPFRQAKWSVVPDEDGEEEADFITQMLSRPPYQGGMTTSFDYVRSLAAKAFWQGYAVWEEVYAVAEVPGHGQCIVLRKLAPREASTVSFMADDHGGFDGIRQRASDRRGGMRTIQIPKNKVLFFTVDKEEHPFYGRSMFEPALYHFDKKHKLYYIAHIAAQIAAVPARIAYQEGGGQDELTPTKRSQLQTALANFGFNTAMIAPKGIKVEAFEGGSDSAISGIMELINHHNIQASQSILAQFIDLGQSGSSSVGSFALSKDSSDIFLMCSQALLNSWAETLSVHLIPKFIDWNFGTGKYPTLVFDPLADETKAAMLEVFSALAVSATNNTSPDFIWELEKRVADQLGLAIDYDKLDEERDAAMEQQAQVAEAIAALQGPGIGNDAPAAPAPDAPPELVAAASQAEVIFLTADYEVVELADPTSKTEQAREAARQRRQSEKGKRDKLGQFSHINEVGSGAGMGTKTDLSAVTGDIQGRLAALGYDLGAPGVDGKFGPITAAAVKKFQSENGLPATGRVDMGTYAMLLELAPKVAKTKKPAKKAKFSAPTKEGGLAAAAAAARKLGAAKVAKSED